MLRKANLLDHKLDLEEVIFMIEKYYSPECTLKSKLDMEKFQAYLEANPMMLRANQEAAAKQQRQEEARRRAEERRLAGEEEEGGEEQ